MFLNSEGGGMSGEYELKRSLLLLDEEKRNWKSEGKRTHSGVVDEQNNAKMRRRANYSFSKTLITTFL